MELDKPDYWFAVKLDGWGWGLPVRWQGWVVLALYFRFDATSGSVTSPRGMTSDLSGGC